LNTSFIAADFFDTESELRQLEGKIDIIWTASFLHLFQWKRQIVVVTKMFKLLKPLSDCIIVGRVIGHKESGERILENGNTVYNHDMHSFKRMFDAACEVAGEKWVMEVKTREFSESTKVKTQDGLMSIGSLIIDFAGKRLE
jgi:hypothetical protein